MSNPLELDFTPLSADEVIEYRKMMWSTLSELTRHPRWPFSYPSQEDMARRFGVAWGTWRDWERDGVETAWAALFRVYRNEKRDVTPYDATLAELEGLWALADHNWSDVARWLEVERSTISYWRFKCRCVPGRYGYGRIVRICYEDMIL